jgi:hypothetical protein
LPFHRSIVLSRFHSSALPLCRSFAHPLRPSDFIQTKKVPLIAGLFFI